MDLIRVRNSAFFTTLLHCILAYSLPNNNLAAQPGPYGTLSTIPNIGILQTPYDKRSQPLLDTNLFMVNPSWHGQDNSNSGFGRKVTNAPPLSPSRTALKGKGLKDPLATPRVKLIFAGTSGILPVNTQPTPPDKYKPPSKVLKPIVSDLTTKPDVSDSFVDSIIGWLATMSKNMLLSSSTPKYSEDKVYDLAPTYPSVYGEAKLPIDTFKSAPSHKPKLPKYPTKLNYPQTSPEINYRKGQETLTSVTPSYKYTLPDLGSSSNPIKNYPTNPVLHNSGNLPEKTNRYVPDRPNRPETETLANKYVYFNPDLPTQQTKPYKAKKPEVLRPTNFDFVSTKPSVEKNEAVALPPVPATMSLLRRTQLVLLNTVAGLPGGRPQALAALRAG